MQQQIHYWLELLFRRRVIVSRVAIAVFSVVFISAIMWPPLYRSTSKILVQANRAQLLVSPGLPQASSNQPTVLANPVSEEELNSEIELLTSRVLIEQALNGIPQPREEGLFEHIVRPISAFLTLPLQGYRVIHHGPRISEREQWAMRLERHLSSYVVRRSNVIEVAFNSHDPAWSQYFLSRLINQYLETHAQLSQNPQAEKFFQEQSRLLQEKLQHSEDNLRAIEVQTGIASLPEQKQAIITSLASFESDYRKTISQIAATDQKIATLDQQLKTVPQRVDKENKLVQNFALQQLKPQVLAMEAERAELLSRYQPNSERIKEIDAKLAAAHKILNREKHTEVQESSNEINPVWEQLNENFAQATTESATLKATEKALSKQIDDYRGQLRSLAIDGVEIERVRRQVDADKEAYSAYVRKSEEARAAQALNQSKILNVSVAEAATFPLQPVSPSLDVSVLLGLALALIAAVAAAYWQESRDPRIYSLSALQNLADLHAVAVIRETP